MVKILKIIVAIGVSVYVYSCANYIPDRVKNNFTYCYDPHASYSQQSLIKFNGFYKKSVNYDFLSTDMKGKILETKNSTGFSYMKFFTDGIYVESFLYSNSVLFDANLIYKNYDKLFYGADVNLPVFEYWGIYKIKGDTLKIMKTNQQNWPNPYWELSEEWYRVDKDSLILLFYNSPTHGENLKKNMKVSTEFIENNIELKSATWLKEQKWFWCDANEWRKYMDSLNIRKKNERVVKYINVSAPSGSPAPDGTIKKIVFLTATGMYGITH